MGGGWWLAGLACALAPAVAQGQTREVVVNFEPREVSAPAQAQYDLSLIHISEPTRPY